MRRWYRRTGPCCVALHEKQFSHIADDRLEMSDGAATGAAATVAAAARRMVKTFMMVRSVECVLWEKSMAVWCAEFA